jgi:hypothetical protein
MSKRELPYLTWDDPLAWLEEMKGAEWERVVRRENSHFRAGLDNCDVEKKEKEFDASVTEHAVDDAFSCDQITITPMPLSWSFQGEKQKKDAAAVYSEGEYVWAVEGSDDGKEVYAAVCYRKGKDAPVWRLALSVAPYLCVKDGFCYLLQATSELRYGACIAVNAMTGGDRRVLYVEKSLRHNLELKMGEAHCVFLISANSGSQKLFHICGKKVLRVGHTCVSFYPVGYDMFGDVCFYGRVDTFDAPWKAFGKGLQLFRLPSELILRNSGIDAASIRHHLLITSSGGVRSVYFLSTVAPKRLTYFIGNCSVNQCDLWRGCEDLDLVFTVAGETATFFSFKRGKLHIRGGLRYAEATTHVAAGVPYVFVHSTNKRRVAKKLMVIVYGGYGLPTRLGTSRWKPYLDDGWCLAFALVRGGGDMGDQWAEDGRRHMKTRSVEDTEAVIRAVQKKTGIDWADTCLYGRSAGGYLVGAVVSRHCQGGLIGSAYAEVPYVDILRTTTNPKLPLTIMEYDEFGNPAEKIEDMETILRISPVDSLPAEGAPGIRVLARTAENDREVLAYESVKWITRLRGYPEEVAGKEKYLFITRGKGHFVHGNRQFAEDFCLLTS